MKVVYQGSSASAAASAASAAASAASTAANTSAVAASAFTTSNDTPFALASFSNFASFFLLQLKHGLHYLCFCC